MAGAALPANQIRASLAGAALSVYDLDLQLCANLSGAMDVDGATKSGTATFTDTVTTRLLSAVLRRFNLNMTEFKLRTCLRLKTASRLVLLNYCCSLKKLRGNSSSGPAAKRPRKALQPSNGRFSESDYSSDVSDFLKV